MSVEKLRLGMMRHAKILQEVRGSTQKERCLFFVSIFGGAYGLFKIALEFF